jgi:polyisoprenoid-binding protein YceI
VYNSAHPAATMRIPINSVRSLRILGARAALFTCLWNVPQSIAAAEHGWIVTQSGSDVRIYVGKSGVFGFAGHTHEVIAPAISGKIRFDEQRIEQAAIELTFDASALRVSPKDEPPEDVPKVQETMLGDKVLDVAKNPTIIYRSRRITVEARNGSRMRLRVAGELTLHGVTRPIEGPVNVNLSDDQLTGSGTLIVRQTNFDIKPVSAGLGSVKVKDEVTVSYTFTAQRES